MDNKEVIYTTRDDGTKWVSRHPADPQHSQHRFYSLGGFLLAFVIIWIIGIVFSILSPIITTLTSTMTLQVMSDPQLADIFTARDIAQLESSIAVYSYPPYMVIYIISLAIDIALVVIVFLRKNLYLQLLIIDVLVGLIGSIVALLFTFDYMAAFVAAPSFVISISVVAGIAFAIIPGVLLIIYFLTSKRVKIYFKAPREECQIIV